MTQFSVISSILSPIDIAIFVRQKYSLEVNTNCSILKTGINHTYKIESGSKNYIFRIYSYNWRTKEEINEELNLLNLLKQHGISVSYPIADQSGNFIQNMHAPEGERFAVLFSHAPGRKIQNYGGETHFEIGKLMAQMHRVTKDLQQDRITYTPDVLLYQSLENIRKFLPDETEEMQFLINTRPLLEKVLQDANSSLLRNGIVHLDIWFDNMNISQNKEVTLFDFDFCGNGLLCMDIAYYVMQLHNTEKDATERAGKLDAFYKGYESIEKISEEEKQLIPTLGVCLFYFYLGVQCQRFDNWSNTFVNEVYLKRYIVVFIKGYYDSIRRNEVSK